MEKIDDKISRFLGEELGECPFKKTGKKRLRKKANEVKVFLDPEEEYDVTEAKENLKALMKAFGGRMYAGDPDTVTLYPFKTGDHWEVVVSIEDYDPISYGINVYIDNDLIGMSGYYSIETDEVDIRTIETIGRGQKKFYDATQMLRYEAQKIGKLDNG
jgi:hypothetical protein